ncbi:uncharacterized protein TNCV_5771 [Trichonephila clavipes]|nr:uncharacterized protein TNCV_5771 [Trichonephila clavipes]
MLTLRYFPKSWKTAVVVPISKPGKNSALAESYRPISLLPVLSKLAEKVILARLNDHLERENILIPEQHGFRPRVSPHPTNSSESLNLLRKEIIKMDAQPRSSLIFKKLFIEAKGINHNRHIKTPDWRLNPDRAMYPYNRFLPYFGTRSSRVHQTGLTRFRRGHLRSMTFVQGVKSFFTCPCSLLASPAHLLDCWGIFLRQLYEEQDLVCDTITRKGQMDLV